MSDIAYGNSNDPSLPPINLPSFDTRPPVTQVTINAQPKSSNSWDEFPIVSGKGTGQQNDSATADTAHDWADFPLANSATAAQPRQSTAPNNNSGVISDVLKSAGGGLVKGGAALVGFPGDMRELIGSGMDWATQKMGFEPPTKERALINSKMPINLQPTTAQVLSGVNPLTGDLHQPETTAGKYAETAAEFVPSALLAPAKSAVGLVRNAIKYGVAPGVASEAAGQATAGTQFEPYARFGAALGTGGLAAGLSRPNAPEQSLLKQMPNYVTPAHIDRAGALISYGKNKGVDITWPEALSRVTGRPVLTDMQRILESTPESRATMQSTLGNRPAQVEQAAQNEFSNLAPANSAPSTIGPIVSGAAESTLSDVRKAINNTARPFYKSAENVLLTPQEMAQVESLPGYAEAAKAVRGDPQLNRYVDHLPDNSVGFLNEVKKYFDQQASNANRPFAPNPNMQRAAGYGGDAKSVSVAAQNKSVDYATALALESDLRQRYLEPLMTGPLGRLAQHPDTKKAIETLFPNSPLPRSANEIATAVSAVAKRSPQAARDLVRAHIEMVFNEATQNLQSGANEFGGAKFAARLVGNPQQRENLKAAVTAVSGPQGWGGFEKFLSILEATGTRQAIGSKTAFNIPELKSLEGGGVLSGTAKLAASPGKWWTIVSDKWSRYQLGQNLDDLARIATDPRSAEVFKRLVSMPTRSREAGALAARLILQSEAAARKPVGN